MATMAGHSELVTGLAFSNDCRHLISVSGDGDDGDNDNDDDLDDDDDDDNNDD